MIPEAKILEIVRGLLQKTRQGRIAWEQSDHRVGQQYSISYPNFGIRISYVRPETEEDYIRFDVLDPEGKLVGGLSAYESSDTWALLAALWSEVERHVTRWDKVLEDVENFINKP